MADIAQPLLLEHPVHLPGASGGSGMGSWFWKTLSGVVLATFAMVSFAVWQDGLQLHPRTIPEPELNRFVETAATAAETQASARVDDVVDAIFAPVTAAIPAYADFHFSVLGEYTQLTALALGDIGGALEDRLFNGYQQRLDAGLSAVDATFDTTYTSTLNAQINETLGNADRRFLTPETQMTLTAMTQRARVTQPISRAFSLAGGIAGRQAVRFVGRQLAGELAESVLKTLGRRVAAKTAGRAAGIGSGVGAGAAAGSLIGPVGTVVGGAAGFIAGWIATDYVLIELEELISRDGFEAELNTMVAQEKAALRAALVQQISDKAATVRLGGLTPAEVLQRESAN